MFKQYGIELSRQTHADGYQAYAQTKGTLVVCWAYAGRKFIEYKQVQGTNKLRLFQ